MKIVRHHRIILSLLAIGGIAAFVLNAGGCTQKNQQVLAKVNSQTITPGDFKERVDKLPDVYKSAVKGHEDEFLDDLIVENLLLQRANNKGLSSDKEVIKLLTDAKNKIMIARLIDLELADRVRVDDKEIADYYAQHKAEFQEPKRYRASHIMVKTEDEAKDILEKLKNGADFAALAKEKSIDSSKDKGGDVGYFSKGDLISEFETAAMKLDKGQISGVVKSPLGYHIIKLTDVREERTKGLNEVRDKIKQELTNEKKKEAFDEFIKELKSKANIYVNKDLMNKLYATPKEKEKE